MRSPAGGRYLITTDVDDFASEDLDAHAMSAVNPDYFMALRFSQHAYREGCARLPRSLGTRRALTPRCT